MGGPILAELRAEATENMAFHWGFRTGTLRMSRFLAVFDDFHCFMVVLGHIMTAKAEILKFQIAQLRRVNFFWRNASQPDIVSSLCTHGFGCAERKILIYGL
jgi:hypothetical protein